MLLQDVHFPKLTKINLKSRSITDEALKTLASIPSLKEKFPTLWYIDLPKNQITDEGLKALAGAAGELKKLSRISL